MYNRIKFILKEEGNFDIIQINVKGIVFNNK